MCINDTMVKSTAVSALYNAQLTGLNSFSNLMVKRTVGRRPEVPS